MFFTDCFSDVPDPRNFTARHLLTDVLFAALVATLCGARNCTEMAYFAETKLDLLRLCVPLEEGAPSHDTFSRVFRLLDPAAFGAAFQKFMTAFGVQARIEAPNEGRAGHIAVDGKSQRRAYEKGRAHMPPMMVSVFDCETFMSLSQVIGAEGGEAAAAIAALNLISIKGRLVTADALHCHRRFTKAVRDGGGDYAIPIKGNQSTLARLAKQALDIAAEKPATAVCEVEDIAHDRHEVRRCFITAFRPPPGKNALIGLKYLGRVEAWRTVGAETTYRVRDYALSKRMTPDELLKLSRDHWGIENHLHWQLDVIMREDEARSRKDNGPANLGVLRRLALNIYRADPRKIPLSHKRLDAIWSGPNFFNIFSHVR